VETMIKPSKTTVLKNITNINIPLFKIYKTTNYTYKVN
jgi:hypothetical protein